MLEIYLSDLQSRLIDAWKEACGDLASVHIVAGSILELDVDAIVSPANSFGFMDGGIDGVYRNFFGDRIEQSVRTLIRDEFDGELVVGQALMTPTSHSDIPYLIAAPTMRVPMRLPAETVHPYLATRAALRIARDHTEISRIAFPGMATGIGGVGAEMCAAQMRQAIIDIAQGHFAMPRDWAEASERHQILYGAKPRNLQWG